MSRYFYLFMNIFFGVILVTLGERTKEMRKLFRLNQIELASIAGISQGNVSEIESDKRPFSYEAITSIIRYFSDKPFSINWLLTGEGEPTVAQPQSPALTETESLLLEEYRAADKQKRKAILQAALGTSHEPRGETL
jgi:transcriptional regulator with XRE-family HTH domain